MLISFAIHPEKAPKPLNRKSAALASNVHNLNILERESAGGGGDGGGIPEAGDATTMLFGGGGSTAVPSDMVRIERASVQICDCAVIGKQKAAGGIKIGGPNVENNFN